MTISVFSSRPILAWSLPWMLVLAAGISLLDVEAQTVKPSVSSNLTGETERAAREPLNQGAGGDSKVYKKSLAAGRKARKAENLPEAERQFRLAVYEAEGFAPKDKRRLESLEGWADVLLAQRRFLEGHRVYEDIVKFREKAYGADHESLVGAWSSVARTAYYAGLYAEAETAWLRAKEICQRLAGQYHQVMGQIWAQLGSTYAAAGKTEQAEAAFRQAIQLLETRRSTVVPNFNGQVQRLETKPDYVSLAALYNDMAVFYKHQKRYPEAEDTFQRSLSLYEREVGKNSQGVAMVAFNLGRFYLFRKRLPEAGEMLNRSLAIRENLLGPKHILVGSTLEALADLYREQGKTADADRLTERAARIRRDSVQAPR